RRVAPGGTRADRSGPVGDPGDRWADHDHPTGIGDPVAGPGRDTHALTPGPGPNRITARAAGTPAGPARSAASRAAGRSAGQPGGRRGPAAPAPDPRTPGRRAWPPAWRCS